MRIGQSRDVHRLVEGRDLIIGGVKIPFEKGLLGHSDADVLLHAIAESILGALSLGDLGHHFPDNSKDTEGMDSLVILAEVKKLMDEKGYKIVNLDSIIVIERPKMAPHIQKMRENIARVLDTDIENINVKATCNESMGYIGRGEGALAEAVVLIDKK